MVRPKVGSTSRLTSKTPTGGTPARSIRIPDNVWEAAKARAERDGTNVSHVVNMLLDGYGRNLVSLPKVQVVFPKTE